MKLKLIVGLGNPWNEYKLTRHNIWFIILDWFQNEFDFTTFLFNKKFNAEISTGKYRKWPTILVKPQTYMNLSWDTVKRIINFYKINPKDILVIHDDIDLSFGKIKLKWNGSHWWHNGIKDIIKKISTDKFWRLKLGIWRPKTKEEVVNYVLSNFKSEELDYRKKNKKIIFDKIDEFFVSSEWQKSS